MGTQVLGVKMKYMIKFRLTAKGKTSEGYIPGLVFYSLTEAQQEADRLNDGAGPHLEYWPEGVPEWSKQSA
jgi:hypothetical protein